MVLNAPVGPPHTSVKTHGLVRNSQYRSLYFSALCIDHYRERSAYFTAKSQISRSTSPSAYSTRAYSPGDNGFSGQTL
jgi:hypothetical protein